MIWLLGTAFRSFQSLLSLSRALLHFTGSFSSRHWELQNNSGGRGSGGWHPCGSDKGDHSVGLLIHIRISNYPSNNMTLSTGAIKYWKLQNNSGGRGVEADIHVEVIEVITVGLLIHIRISNYASNNMTLSTGAISTERCKITLGGGGVEVDIHVED